MFDPMIEVLKNEGKIPNGLSASDEEMCKVDYRDIWRAINSTAFLKTTPLVSN
jgi:hypothetical protein